MIKTIAYFNLNKKYEGSKSMRVSSISYSRIILAIAIIFSVGCSSLPPADFTVQDVGVLDNRKDVELKSITVGYASHDQQGKVEGTHVVPPLWKEALTDALNRSLAFNDTGPVKVNLSVRIVEFDVPAAGFAMRTKVAAIYEIVDRASGDLLFAESISSEGVVPMDYAFMGVIRATESMNRAVRNNIADFISSLEAADLTKPMYLAE